jgi:CxxC motif-containing protein (DUF1111 family)
MSQKLPFGQSLGHMHAVALLAFLAVGVSSALAAADDGQIELGRQLFEHKWVPNDPLTPGGDGLGPLSNADSCVACHHLGATGGAGAGKHNVELMTLGSGLSVRRRNALQEKAGKLHPAFAADNGAAATVMLHKFGTDPGFERWRLSVLGIKLPAHTTAEKAAQARRAAAERDSSAPPVAPVPRTVGLPLLISRRNTTALFGAGLIDSIPEKVLLELEKTQDERSDELRGRLARTASGAVGRFGWRGQVGNLREFVVSACAMELGLQNEKHPQALDPLDPKLRLKGNDLTQAQCDALATYCASLPAPVRIEPASARDAEHARRGEKLFASCGCTACHVPEVGKVEGIYSDLLLHDMGEVLSDPISANPEKGTALTVTEVVGGGSSAYGGGGGRIVESLSPAALALRREWRTPPLWGLRDSAPYLHDGRARTLSEAITAHGGEAESSAQKFRGLDFVARSDLLDFLNTLAAPAANPRAVAEVRVDSIGKP